MLCPQEGEVESDVEDIVKASYDVGCEVYLESVRYNAF